jgi:hypothetical protein
VATSKKAPIRQASTFHDVKRLSPQEELVLRLHGSESVADEVLERKTNDPELLARLFELERLIIKKAQSRNKKS